MTSPCIMHNEMMCALKGRDIIKIVLTASSETAFFLKQQVLCGK